MVMRLLPILLLTLLCGCGDAAFKLLDRLFGKKTNVVILADTPISLGQSEVTFKAHGDAIVVGQHSAVCVVLAGNIPLQNVDVMDAEYERLLGGVEFTATVETTSGESYELCQVNQTWSRSGRVVERDELSACARLHCSSPVIETGTAINSISINANGSLVVEGIFWESTNAWDEAPN